MKPILFNTEMVRAILDGRKTVKANARLFDEACAELTRAKKCITDCETYLILGDGRYAARTIADWRKNQNEHLRIRRDL